VASIYGKVLRELGLLSKGEVVVKVPSNFIGSVLGESEKLTAAILDAALGCVLVIDEAYGLFSDKSSDPFRVSCARRHWLVQSEAWVTNATTHGEKDVQTGPSCSAETYVAQCSMQQIRHTSKECVLQRPRRVQDYCSLQYFSKKPTDKEANRIEESCRCPTTSCVAQTM
jgi:hypothetical protein